VILLAKLALKLDLTHIPVSLAINSMGLDTYFPLHTNACLTALRMVSIRMNNIKSVISVPQTANVASDLKITNVLAALMDTKSIPLNTHVFRTALSNTISEMKKPINVHLVI